MMIKIFLVVRLRKEQRSLDRSVENLKRIPIFASFLRNHDFNLDKSLVKIKSDFDNL